MFTLSYPPTTNSYLARLLKLYIYIESVKKLTAISQICFTTLLPFLFSLSLSLLISKSIMSGVWVFDKNGVARLIQNPTKESFERREPVKPGAGTATAPGARPRVLVYLPTNQVIHSYTELEQRLTELGWSRYHDGRNSSNNLLQFHKSEDSAHLISLPTNFANFRSFHMYDIVVKNRSFFEVRDPS